VKWRPSCLDLFCGLGGFSDGFAHHGFYCVGVDIAYVGYPYHLVLRDVRLLDGRDFEGLFDVIVGSPPCRDFSQAAYFGRYKWRVKPDAERALGLVYKFLEIVEDAKPRFWVMENVPKLEEYLGVKPRMVVRFTPTMKRALWGRFPDFLVPVTVQPAKRRIQGSLRSWKRGKIPFSVSCSLAEAIKATLG